MGFPGLPELPIMATCASYHQDIAKQEKPFLPESELSGVLEWIDRADRANRIWARNFLAVFAALAIPLLIAVKLGLLAH